MSEPFIIVQRYRIDPVVYRTDMPLIVAERCRNAGPYADGSQPETPPLITTWYALRWLMAAYPHHRGFNQKVISQIAGYDQKSAHKRLRKLHELGLIIEVGRESYPNLRGGDDKAKSRPIYSILIDELDRLSATLAASLMVQWEHRLFGSSQTPSSFDSQMALDLASDPLQDQGGVSDPVADQASDPVADQVPDPVADHVGRQVGRQVDSSLLANPNEETGVPAAPANESPLQMHPLELWARLSTQQREIDILLLRQMATDHNLPSGGYGWYWVGRAIMVTAMGPEPSDWWAKLRIVMRQWRDTGTYGIESPTVSRRPRATSPAAPAQTTNLPTTGGKLSDMPILIAKGISGRERADILARFRRAAAGGDIATQQRILSDLSERTNDPTNRTL